MVPPRKYTLNEEFFDNIETEEQAYWLGFITADGCVADYTSYSPSYTLMVELADVDRGHLEKLRHTLGSNRPFYSHYSKSYDSSCTVAHFNSKHMIMALSKLGVKPKKSATVHPWVGPEKLMRHYWRGLFDGDGSLGPRHRTDRSHGVSWTLSVVGSESCVAGFADWAGSFTSCNKSLYDHGGGCWHWGVEGGQLPQSIAEELYRDATVALDRKQVLANILRSINIGQVRKQGIQRRVEFLKTAPRDSKGHIISKAPLLSWKGGDAL